MGSGNSGLVHCPTCRKTLAVDFLECPECGTKNPQLHLLKRVPVTILLDAAVNRRLEKISIRTGRPVDDLLTEAAEQWVMRQ